MAIPLTCISTVERDTGLLKDALRVWERRYDFPQPSRDSKSERIYPAALAAWREQDAGYTRPSE